MNPWVNKRPLANLVNHWKQCDCSIRPPDCHPCPLPLLSLLRVNWCTQESSGRKSPFYKDVWYTQQVVSRLYPNSFVSWHQQKLISVDLNSSHNTYANSREERWYAFTSETQTEPYTTLKKVSAVLLVSLLLFFTNILLNSVISISAERTYPRFTAILVFPTQTIPYPYSVWRKKNNFPNKGCSCVDNQIKLLNDPVAIYGCLYHSFWLQ